MTKEKDGSSLTCECNHLRREHESGSIKLTDSSVSKCMIKDCPCKEYHANYDTRKQIWKIRYKALFWSGLVMVGAVFMGYIGTEMIDISVDSVMDSYTLVPKYHTLHKYQNGTITNSTNYYDNEIPSDNLKDSAWLPMFLILAIIALFGSMGTFFAMMENDYKRMINE